MKLLYKTNGVGGEIAVYEAEELFGEKGRFRYMQFSGEAVQGAIDLDRPERIVFEYPRALIHLMKMNRPDFEDVFAIGHGIGTIPGYFADKRFTIAELDEDVAAISRQWFGCSRDVMIGDGRELLAEAQNGRYDYIVVDAFTADGTPRHLVSEGMFRIARDKLHAGGAILLNLFGRGGGDPFTAAIYATLGAQFPHTAAFSMAVRSTGTTNIVMMGAGQSIRWQSRHMAGFVPYDPGPGYLLTDEPR